MRKVLPAVMGALLFGMGLLAPQVAHADSCEYQPPIRTGVVIQPYVQIGFQVPVRTERVVVPVREEQRVVVVRERRPEHGRYRRHHKDRVVYVRERGEGRRW